MFFLSARFVDGHHIVHWADGGETSLDNLVSLCRFHHRLVHEGGYHIVRDDQAFRFFRGDGFEVRATSERFQRIYADAARQRRACAMYEVQEVRAGYLVRPPAGRGAPAMRPP